MVTCICEYLAFNCIKAPKVLFLILGEKYKGNVRLLWIVCSRVISVQGYSQDRIALSEREVKGAA